LPLDVLGWRLYKCGGGGCICCCDWFFWYSDRLFCDRDRRDRRRGRSHRMEDFEKRLNISLLRLGKGTKEIRKFLGGQRGFKGDGDFKGRHRRKRDCAVHLAQPTFNFISTF
jgi:hypothetical protein